MQQQEYPCITCKIWIDNKCNRTDYKECFSCEYNECSNCIQFGNLDCDGDVVV